MSNSAQSLSLERKIKMHEAREGIINRLAMTLPSAINLDRFLNVIVSELGRMMNVDRCDVLELKQLSDRIDIRQPIRLDDTAAAGLDQKVRFLAASLGTRSLLVVPVVLN